MGTYRNKEIQSLFNISSDTVRIWADEFTEYLSPLATPGTGKHRVFNDDDLRVFALVSDMRASSFSYDEIHVSLKNGNLGELPEIAQDRALEYSAELQLTVAQDAISKLRLKLEEVETEARKLHDENIRLQTSEEAARSRVGELTEELSKEREKNQTKISELERQIGKLEGILEFLQKQKDESD